jgi:hypothetical protein
MSADIGHVATPATNALWQVEAAQLLEEHHLVGWAHHPMHRRRFAEDLACSLASMDDTQVCMLPGHAIRDIFSFCNFLERSIRNDRVRRSIDAKGGIVDALRMVSDRSGSIKRRYIIWQDADVMLRYDHRLFGRLADAMMGVSAELEYTSEDLLVIQRIVFVGAPSLDVYAEDGRGQFRRWFAENNEEPLWATVTGVKAPRVLRYRIDPMFDDGPVAPVVSAPLVAAPALPIAAPVRKTRRRRA